jgi:hypothetical protein
MTAFCFIVWAIILVFGFAIRRQKDASAEFRRGATLVMIWSSAFLPFLGFAFLGK